MYAIFLPYNLQEIEKRLEIQSWKLEITTLKMEILSWH